MHPPADLEEEYSVSGFPHTARYAQFARHMIRFPGGRFRLRSGFCFGRLRHHGYIAALCPRPHYSLDRHLVLFCLARQRR